MPLSRVSLLAGLFLSIFLCPLQAQVAGVHRELYFNLSRDGFSLGQMTNHPNFLAGRPDQTNILANLQSETSRGDDYGQRLRGYITAPNTGSYTFWIAADETANLLLSTNENPAFKRLIAWVDPRSVENNNTTHYGRQSAPIALQAGRRYYVEELHHEVNLADHFSVQWQILGGALESPIPGTRLVYEIAPLIIANLTNLTVEEGRPVVFGPTVANFLPQSYRWQRNGVGIPGRDESQLRAPGDDSRGQHGVVPCVHHQSGGRDEYVRGAAHGVARHERAHGYRRSQGQQRECFCDLFQTGCGGGIARTKLPPQKRFFHIRVVQ